MTNNVDTILTGFAKLWPHAFCHPPRAALTALDP
jgi:hypothetical protein